MTPPAGSPEPPSPRPLSRPAQNLNGNASERKSARNYGNCWANCLLGQKLRKSKFSHVITAAITCWKSFDLIMARARACPGTYCCQPSPLTPLPSDGRGENKERLRFFTVTGTEANTIAGKKNCFRPDTRP